MVDSAYRKFPRFFLETFFKNYMNFRIQIIRISWTHRKHIQWILPAPPCKLVLYNKMNYNKKWHRAFNLYGFEPFYAQDQAKKVFYTKVTAAFRLNEFPDLDCDVLQLPFAGQHQDMYIFLPKTANGLTQLEAKLFDPHTCHIWYSALTKMPTKLVNVAVPIFFLATFKSMKSTLSKLGLDSIVTAQAGAFAAWTNDKDFHVTEYFQDIKIKMNRYVTGLGYGDSYGAPSKRNVRRMSSPSLLGPAVDFIASHPFVFIVHDRATDAVQLIGRICDPVTHHPY